jgi:hypothetical protein
MGMQVVPMSAQAELTWKKQILTCYRFIVYKILEIATQIGLGTRPDYNQSFM